MGCFTSGCTNTANLAPIASLLSSTSPTVTTSTTPTDNYVISSVTINAPVAGSTSAASAAATALTSTIYLDSKQSTTAASTHCNVSTTGAATKPCVCQFSWSESNPNAGTSVVTNRKVQTAVNLVQPEVFGCPPPSVYSTEIIVGTQISITIVAGPGNPDASTFTTTPYTYTVASSSSGGFQAAQGNSFNNILHYVCYNNFLRGQSIQSYANTANNGNTNQTHCFTVQVTFV
ncbi:unnamed protein product [Sphagnum tenellum]